MLQSVIENASSVASYPELQGARVLITGLSLNHGVEVARAFADQGARLVLQMEDRSHEAETLLEVLAQTADEVKVFNAPIAGGEACVPFAQQAAQAYGGLDVVINIIDGIAPGGEACATVQDIENRVSERLSPACLVTRVTANRMRVTWTEGLVLNVLVPTASADRRATAYNCIARAALAAMTRAEAQKWADEAIRINAVGPRDVIGGSSGDSLSGEPEVAALALFLASKRGRMLSGHIFDLDSIAAGCC
jgi:NAD(P)-dependent dehydrogenase (short-subunit alcohol dehydrogenase family)